MKLIVPYCGELLPADARLVRLAEFLGIACAPTPVIAEEQAWLALAGSGAQGDCLLLNADVVCRCFAGGELPPDFVSSLGSRFARVLVCAIRPEMAHNTLLAALTDGRYQAVQKQSATSCTLSFDAGSRDICDAFAGMSLTVPFLPGDTAFSAKDKGDQTFIRLDGEAFSAVCTVRGCEMVLLGSGEVVDLDAEAGDSWLTEICTRFIPHVLALRYIFGEQCWRPVRNFASVIVDDPLLRPSYGFLNFAELLRMMDQHNFKTTVAFIPHNFRRNASSAVRVFQQNADRLSLCFHGNDHTGAEFASKDPAELNTMLQVAESRMTEHGRLTGLPSDRVMVFPQGRFSVEAMSALRAHNFEAAVNTVQRPYGQPERLTIRELSQPAVLRYGGFPLFLRKCSRHTQDAEIAFKLLFGIPVFIVEHHDVFADPQRLLDAVDRINRAASGVCWSSAGDAVRGAVLRRRTKPGFVQVKAYARRVRIENPGSVTETFQVEWDRKDPQTGIEGVYQNGGRKADYALGNSAVMVTAPIEPGGVEEFTLRDVANNTGMASFGIRHATRVFVRRRLSEIRDNYISKSPALLAAAKTLQRSFRH